MDVFIPQTKQLRRIRCWTIKPHRVRDTFVRSDGSHFPDCCQCHKNLNYYDLAFYCITQPNRIVGYASYAKVCFECGLIMLAKVTPQNQTPQLKAMELEYKGA